MELVVNRELSDSDKQFASLGSAVGVEPGAVVIHVGPLLELESLFGIELAIQVEVDPTVQVRVAEAAIVNADFDHRRLAGFESSQEANAVFIVLSVRSGKIVADARKLRGRGILSIHQIAEVKKIIDLMSRTVFGGHRAIGSRSVAVVVQVIDNGDRVVFDFTVPSETGRGREPRWYSGGIACKC